MSEFEDSDLLDIHNQLQKFLIKSNNERESVIKNIHTMISKLILYKLPYGADKTIVNKYKDLYNIEEEYAFECINQLNKEKKTKKNKKIEIEEENISYKEWKDLLSNIETLEKKVEDIDITLPYFLANVETIVTEYNQEIKRPIVSQFIGGKSNDKNNKCKELYTEYINKAKDIIGEERFYKMLNKQPKIAYTSISSLCLASNINNITSNVDSDNNDDYKEDNKVQYDDIGRVNLNQKYKYERKCHFRDTLQQFQALQNKQINEKVYTDLEEMIRKHSLLDESFIDKRKFRKVTREHIRTFLSESNYNNHYEDAQLIYTKLTGKPAPNISKYEKDLYADFDELVNSFMQLPDNIKKKRKNFLNNQYVLNQLLKRRNIKVPESDLSYLKTPSRLKDHDEIYGMCCEILNWNYTPLG